MKIKQHLRDDHPLIKFEDPRWKPDAVMIIGNGFDLNLGLKTSYNDFVDSGEFKLIDQNLLAEHIASVKQIQNWVDLEKELANYKYKFNTVTVSKSFNTEYKELKDALKKYLKRINKSFDLNPFNRNVITECYNHNTIILNFNYTNTIELILNKFSEEMSFVPHGDCYKYNIHGSLEEDHIIMGVGDSTKINLDHIFLRKSVDIKYQSTDFNEYIAKSNTIGIFGHSLGETDHMYFEEYFLGACKKGSQYSGKDVYLYYYDEKSRINLHKQLEVLTGGKIGLFKRLNRVKFISTKVPEKVLW